MNQPPNLLLLRGPVSEANMGHAFYLIALLLFAAGPAHSDPISVPSLPPQPAVLGALLLEVLVVAAILRSFKLRGARFIAGWYAVNLFTFYILLQGVLLLSNSAALAEVVVFAAEAIALFGVSRVAFFKKSVSRPVPFGWALAASLAGNLTSRCAFAVADFLIHP
ncbi:MAG TPA: hypothetical protein VNZ22_12370 [Bacillota bacterium]|nr:hypothetical protein [Bacillota bacterium]